MNKDIFETLAKNDERQSNFFNLAEEERKARNNSSMQVTGGLVMHEIPEALDSKQRKVLNAMARRNSAN